MLIVAQGCVLVSVVALAGVRARVGWRGTYSHPGGKVTLILLVPAQLLTLAFALFGFPI